MCVALVLLIMLQKVVLNLEFVDRIISVTTQIVVLCIKLGLSYWIIDSLNDQVTATDYTTYRLKAFLMHFIPNSGEFGDVYQGTLTRPEEEPILVAVKTLKVG